MRRAAILVLLTLAACDTASEAPVPAAAADTDAAVRRAIEDTDAALREARTAPPAAPLPEGLEQSTDRTG